MTGFRALGIFEEEDYLSSEERAERARTKEEELENKWRLTPDWFRRGTRWCLPPEGLNVAVIGGGFSGLSAGWYLKECGAEVSVFEARSTIGGRVRTDRSFAPGKWIEAGAELIGENHALWRILARRFGLTLKAMSDEGSYPGLKVRVRFGGSDLTDPEKRSLGRELLPHLTQLGEDAKPIDPMEPWTSPGAAGFDAMSVEQRLNEILPATSSYARQWLAFTLGNDNCASIGRQSYLGLLASLSAARMGDDPKGMMGYWFSTETERCHEGNDKLTSAFAGVLSGSVFTSRRVDRVVIAPWPVYPPVWILSSELDSAGRVLHRRVGGYHYAILTTPPTVWKAIKVFPSFSPIARTISHGPAVKFFSRYPEEFWKTESEPLAPLAKWDELGSVWEGTDNQSTPPGFVLSVFSGGDFVQPPAAYDPKLTTIYPGRKATCEREELVDWTKEKDIEAGYAIPTVGQASTVNPALVLPHENRLYFAGEQASPGFFGYMEGALQAGARAARDIVRAVAVPCSMVAAGDPRDAGDQSGVTNEGF
ncbi:MAG TPA: FAD-dependent oxidoreductase [Solirubrobacterales bacterium]